MKDRPILFSAPMVQAILAGKKTQTRRVAKSKWANCHLEMVDGALDVVNTKEPEARTELICPYGQPGDRLWVREAWAHTTVFGGAEMVVYRGGDNRTDYGGPWKPSIHMPRWASRITLEVTGVRVERLQNISEADCIAEGCTKNHNNYHWGGPHKAGGLKQMATAKQAYQDLWESINGPCSWEANPWVWVVEFKRVKGCAA